MLAYIKLSSALVLICSILLSDKVSADEASEEYPNLSCHDGYNTPDVFGLVSGPLIKTEAVDTCKGHALEPISNNHECYRQCIMESLFIIKAEDYSKNNLEWSFETTKLLSEEDMAEAMRNNLFYVEITGSDTASRLAKEIHLKCTDKAIKLTSRPCKEWKAFNDCVDSIWLCKNQTSVSEKVQPIDEAAKITDVNQEKNSGLIIQNGKDTTFVLFSIISLFLINIGV